MVVKCTINGIKKPFCYQSEGLFHSGLFTKLDLLFKTKNSSFYKSNQNQSKINLTNSSIYDKPISAVIYLISVLFWPKIDLKNGIHHTQLKNPSAINQKGFNCLKHGLCCLIARTGLLE